MSVHHPRRARGNPPGVHHLRSQSVLRAFVRSAELGAGDRVFDLGAGPGTLTAALLSRGAIVTAVERDPHFARELRRRFRDAGRVRVVETDLLRIRIPRRARVVANVPFAVSGALLARLLDPPGPPRAGIDLIVEHGFARRLSSRLPRSAHAAWWTARYQLSLGARVPRTAFDPAPGVDAALLRIRARGMLDRASEHRLRLLLASAYSHPAPRAATVSRRFAGRNAGPAILREAGIDPRLPAALVPPDVWASVARGPGRSRAAGG